MNVAFLVTLAGPLLGASGWLVQSTWLLWVGVFICTITLLLNLASGVMKLPILPAAFMAVSAVLVSPWYVGVGVGLIAWTALEAIGEIAGLLKRVRRQE